MVAQQPANRAYRKALLVVRTVVEEKKCDLFYMVHESNQYLRSSWFDSLRRNLLRPNSRETSEI